MDNNILEEFDAYLKRSRREEKDSLVEMIDILIDRLDQNTAEAVRRCAIPRWFNLDVLIAMMDTGTEAQNLEIFNKIRSLPFVHFRDEGSYAYRLAARQYFFTRLRQSQPDHFIELHRLAHQYFDRKSNYETIIARRNLSLTQDEGDYLREKVYHLLFIDPERGYRLLDQVFMASIRLGLYGESATLLAFGREHSTDRTVPESYQLQLDYYQAVLAYIYENWQECDSLLKQLKQRPLPEFLEARVLAQQGTLAIALNQPDQAVLYFQESKRKWDDLKDMENSAAMANNLGNAFLRMKNNDQAERFFKAALKSFIELEDEPQQAVAYNNLGNLYSRKEEWDKAIEYYLKSLAIKEKSGDQLGSATTLANLGIIYYRLSEQNFNQRKAAEQTEIAIKNYQKSISISRELGAHLLLARTLYRLALIQYQTAQVRDAHENIKQAVEIFTTLNHPELGQAQALARKIDG